MDNNSNSLSSTILQPSQPVQYSTLSSDNSSGFFDSLKNINMTTWILIILILSFLGFNIFVYLAKGTQDITNFFAPLLQYIYGTTVSVAGQTVDVSAEGAKAVVSGTAGAINTGLTSIQDVTPNKAPSSIQSQPIQGTTVSQQNAAANRLNKALSTSQSQNEDYEAHQAPSSVHSAGKAGYCFIGEDRGFRSCALVNENDTCMSGDIFPSQELCINPSLRS